MATLPSLSTCGGPAEKLGRPLPLDGGALFGVGGQGGFTAPAGSGGDKGLAGTTGAAGTSFDAGTDAISSTDAAGGTTGAAGTGAAGTTGGAGTGGAGTTGVAGTNGGAGTTGSAGTTGAAGTGAPDGGTDTAPPGCNCSLKVQYRCLQNGTMPTQAEYSLRVVNTGTTSISLSSVTVRYWYTSDGTGTQSGSCNSMAHPCTITFLSTPAKPGADHYAVVSFGGGTLPAGGDTGDIGIQMRGTSAYNQTNDYSFMSTGANTLDHPKMTGYVAGRLLWGMAP